MAEAKEIVWNKEGQLQQSEDRTEGSSWEGPPGRKGNQHEAHDSSELGTRTQDPDTITIAGSRFRECPGSMCRWTATGMQAGNNDTSHLYVSLPVAHQGKTKWIDFALRAGPSRRKPVMETEAKLFFVKIFKLNAF